MRRHIHKNRGKSVVALCDDDITKPIEEGDLVLDASSEFYNDDGTNENELIREIKDADSINAIGPKSIEFLISQKIITGDQIKRIRDTPYAVVLLK